MHSYHRHSDHYVHHPHRHRRGRHHAERHHRQRSQERRLPSSSRFEDEHASSKKRQRSEEPSVDRGRVKRNHIETAAATPSPKKSLKETMKAPVKELTSVKKPMESIPYSTLDKKRAQDRKTAKASTLYKTPTPESSDKESTPGKGSSSDNASTPDKVSTPEKEPVKETVIALEADEEEEKAVMEPILLSTMTTKPETTPVAGKKEQDQSPLPMPWKEMKSRTGQQYYYNKDTGKSTWDKPVAERQRSSPLQPRPRHHSRDNPRPVAQNLVHRPVASRTSPPSYDRHHRVRYEAKQWVSRRDGRSVRVQDAYYFERDYGRVSRGYR